MDLLKPYNRGRMLYDIKSGLKTNELAWGLNNAFGMHAIFECTAQDWVARIRTGNHDVKDLSGSGSPSWLDDQRLRQLARNDLQQKTR